MKKLFSCLLLTSFLSACSGNPPAWWNPNNRYGTADGTPAVQKPAAKPKAVVVTEEEIDLPDTTYEEVTLTPMPDEENENATGASSAQNDKNLPAPSVLD